MFIQTGVLGVAAFVAGFVGVLVAAYFGGGETVELAVTGVLLLPLGLLCLGLVERWIRSKARRRMLSDPRWKLVAEWPAVPEKVGEDPPQPGDDSSERP